MQFIGENQIKEDIPPIWDRISIENYDKKIVDSEGLTEEEIFSKFSRPSGDQNQPKKFQQVLCIVCEENKKPRLRKNFLRHFHRLHKASPDCDIALIGLEVMGQNLILNMNEHGFKVCAYNRTTEKVDDFLKNEAKGTEVVGAHSLEEMVAKLKKPRRVMILVKAGAAVDSFIEKLVPLLEKGDIIIDGGNSEYQDTVRRVKELEDKGILYVGSGVSGGEEGARYGPSLMPGGNPGAWPAIKPIFQAICAKAGEDPCCDWVGEGGSGHFVKMVHNGIEYGDMQLICEAYHLMKDTLGMSHDEMSETFKKWNEGELDSFLIKTSANILNYRDESGDILLEKIKDSAGQKGTGKWTRSLEYGMPVTLIGESVFARCLSSLKEEREKTSTILRGPEDTKYEGDKAEFVEAIRQALYASKIVSYAQGFMLLRQAAKEFGWNLNYGGIALMWRGGCIIRSRFLGNIKAAFEKNPALDNLLLDDFFRDAIHSSQKSWRKVVAQSVLLGVPTPCFSSALAFFDGYRSKKLPANLIQAQRDYFGAHTYELLSSPGKFVHTNWTGTGGNLWPPPIPPRAGTSDTSIPDYDHDYVWRYYQDRMNDYFTVLMK